MEIINFFNCSNHYEARQKEQEYFLLLNANLNSIEPFPPPKPLPIKPPKPIKVTYHCNGCDVDFDSLDNFTIHNQTATHIQNENNMKTKQLLDKMNDDNPRGFLCELCHFNTSNKKDYRRHILTRKHLLASFDTNLPHQKPSIELFACECGKKYTYKSGLWRHKKKCSHTSTNNVPDEPEFENSFVHSVPLGSNDTPFDFSVMFEILKQNQEFKDLLIEQNKQMMELVNKAGNTTNNNTNIKNQNNNNHFNIQMFLNETCKDAINIEDFINTLIIDTKTIEYAGQHGHVNGITNIFLTRLKELGTHLRPFHCTDAKREVMYMKDANIWSKDNDSNTKMLAAIKRVSNLNMKQLQPWIDENPDSSVIGTDKYEEQIRIMSGVLDVRSNKELILKNLAKEVFIDKANHA
jgi:hypothetical protein